MQKPRPSRRPRSAGTTRTRSYFESKEGISSGNDESEEVPAPFFHSNDAVVPPKLQPEVDEVGPFLLLGNLDDDEDIFQWDTVRAMKPQDRFVDDMQFSFTNVYKYLTGKTDSSCTQSNVLCDPSKSTFTISDDHSRENNHPTKDVNSLKARGPIGLLYILYNYIATYLKNDSGKDSRSEEDGLSLESTSPIPAAKSRNHVRVEERIRRDLSLEKRSSTSNLPNGASEGTSAIGEAIPSPEKTSITANIDESFWMGAPQLVGPEKCGGNIQQEVELTIHVKQIKFSQHPELTVEEKALNHISDLYERYRAHLEANTFHYLVTRLTEILQSISFIHAKRDEESKEASDMMFPLLDDLKSTSLNLVTESEAIRDIGSQMKELLGATEGNGGFAHAGVELKTTASVNEKLNNDVKRLVEELDSRKRVFAGSQTPHDEPSVSGVNSYQFLQDVESTLSGINHHLEVMELFQSSHKEEGLIPKEEKFRRRRISSERYVARLLVNGSVVGDTKAEQLDWPSFSVGLSHRFICKMPKKPTDLCIQIWRSVGFMPDKLVSTLGLPDQRNVRITSLRSELGDWLQFSSNNGPDLQRRLKGSLWVASSCKVRTMKLSSPATRIAKIPTDQSKRLIRPPMDEHGDQKNKQVKKMSNNHFFPDRQSMMAFKLPSSGILFSNKSLLEEPLRHALIKKRKSNPTWFPSPIPINELSVQNSDIYRELLRKDEESIDEIIIKERSFVDNQHVMDIFRGVKEYNQLEATRRRKHHFSEVIRDVGLFRFANEQEFELPFPPRKRNLFPASNVMRLQGSNARSQTHSSSLLLTILGGTNVPTKLEGGDDVAYGNTPQQEMSKVDDDELNPDTNELFSSPRSDERGLLVKIRFRGNVFQTKVANGRSMTPQWKETICVPLCDMLEESSPILLQDEVVDMSLFDCSTVDLRHMGGYYEDEETKSAEFRYLGHVSLPLGVILREGTMMGHVLVDSPDCVVGFVKESCPIGISSGENEESQGTRSNTMLHLHATTEPLIIVPPRLRPEFPSKEDSGILSRVEQWSRHHLSHNWQDVEDHCSVLWPDIRGNSILVSRFLTEQAPPPGFDTLASVAHYVSLLPALDNFDWNALGGRDNNTVATSQQFLDIMAGNREEHAILLTNFFLYLGKKRPTSFAADIFLAVGVAVPEGETAWVMRRCQNNREVVFWDAVTGCAYLQNDESCPLQKIYYLASIDNQILANAQRDKKPQHLDFDLSNSRKWAPLHLDEDGKSRIPIMTMQEENLHFTSPDIYRARDIQAELSESIQNAIRGWRRRTTSFRSDVGTKIAYTTEKLEHARMSGRQISKADITLSESITKTREVFGFTLHMPFTSIKNLLARVEATEIYRNNNPRVEFAVAVSAFPYPGGVISVWVYVCSLVPKLG